MDKEKLISYIQLANTSGIGPISFKRALERYGNVDNAISEISKKKDILPRNKAEEELMKAELKGVKIITKEDKEYPYNLKQIEDCPPILYALGNIDLLQNNNMLAVVGSRSASLSALKFAEYLSSKVGEQGITVVSGMARGIDASAHTGAVNTKGGTIAVLGTGIDIVYPKENEKLYQEVAKNGLILSEYPFNTKPQASNFPRRNRIVSGLSKGVLVVEAGSHSGSMITANQALEQGRDVFAVPGAPYDGRSTGCNKLIKDGAYLVNDVEDILDNFNFSQQIFIPKNNKKDDEENLFEYSLDNTKNNSDSAQVDDEYSKLLSLISESGEDIDELIRACNLPTEKVLTMIVELELDDKVIRIPGNKIARA